MPRNRRKRQVPILDYAAVMGKSDISYLMRDDFTTNRAAGSVHNTAAEPGPGTRVVVDTGSKLSIATGLATFASGGGAGNPGLWYAIQTRAAGRALFIQFSPATLADNYMLGFNVAQTGTDADGILFRSTSGTLSVRSNSAAINAGTYAALSSYRLAIIMRATGMHYLIKGGVYTNWTLLYSSKLVSSNLYPYIGAAGATDPGGGTSDTIRIPDRLVLLVPLASDAFTRSDGAIGNTGGGGSEESGGSGLAWTAQAGTWVVSTNKAMCSAVAGGLGIATVDASTPDVVVEAVVTRVGTVCGLVLRYTDANNYIKAVLGPSNNLSVIEVVGGTPNTLTNNTATYNAANRLIISLDSAAVRVYYGELLVNTATTAVTTGNNHGLFTDNVDGTYDNFVVWAKTGYTTLDDYINP